MVAGSSTASRPGPEDAALTRDLAGIEMRFAVEPNWEARIEETLMHGASLGMEGGDLRVLSVLTTWLGVHSARVRAGRLRACLGAQPSPRVRAYWAAAARWLWTDRRVGWFAELHEGGSCALLAVGNEFQIARRGEDERFAGSALRVPAGVLRARPSDVLSPESLVRRHAGYRNRVQMGANWRADVWTVLEHDPELSPAEVARRAGCSVATARPVVRDFTLLRAAGR